MTAPDVPPFGRPLPTADTAPLPYRDAPELLRATIEEVEARIRATATGSPCPSAWRSRARLAPASGVLPPLLAAAAALDLSVDDLLLLGVLVAVNLVPQLGAEIRRIGGGAPLTVGDACRLAGDPITLVPRLLHGAPLVDFGLARVGGGDELPLHARPALPSTRAVALALGQPIDAEYPGFVLRTPLRGAAAPDGLRSLCKRRQAGDPLSFVPLPALHGTLASLDRAAAPRRLLVTSLPVLSESATGLGDARREARLADAVLCVCLPDAGIESAARDRLLMGLLAGSETTVLLGPRESSLPAWLPVVKARGGVRSSGPTE